MKKFATVFQFITNEFAKSLRHNRVAARNDIMWFNNYSLDVRVRIARWGTKRGKQRERKRNEKWSNQQSEKTVFKCATGNTLIAQSRSYSSHMMPLCN